MVQHISRSTRPIKMRLQYMSTVNRSDCYLLINDRASKSSDPHTNLRPRIQYKYTTTNASAVDQRCPCSTVQVHNARPTLHYWINSAPAENASRLKMFFLSFVNFFPEKKNFGNLGERAVNPWSSGFRVQPILILTTLGKSYSINKVRHTRTYSYDHN